MDGGGGGGKRGGGKGGAKAAASGAMGARMLSCVLSGIHRALPFAAEAEAPEALVAQLDALFRVAHAPSFGTAVQALMVLGQLSRLDLPAARRVAVGAAAAAARRPFLPRALRGASPPSCRRARSKRSS